MKQLSHSRWSRLWSAQTAVVLLAICVLFFKIGSVPHGMTVDEAGIGYNGYAVITTGRDEWLKPLPFSFRSFGDYKAPLAIYLNGLFTAILGLKLWVIRLPFVISGVLAVWGIQRLVAEMYKYHHPLSSWTWWTPAKAGVLAGGILITTPWFIHFARTGFESGISLTLLIWAAALLMSFINTSGKKRAVQLIPSVILSIAAMYSYHSAKVVVPLIGIVLVVLHWRKLKKAKLQLLAGSFLVAMLLLPMMIDTVIGQGGARFTQTTIFSEVTGAPQVAGRLFSNVAVHLDPRFLVGGLTTTLRHGDGKWGVLLPVIFCLWLVGVVSIVFWRKNYATRRLWLIGILWSIIGFLPAVVGSEVPHSNRALLALPGIVITVLLGVEYIGTWISFSKINRRIKGSHREKDSVLKAVLGTLVLIHLLTFVSYQHHYYTTFAAKSADAYLDGYLETFRFIIPYETGTAGQEVERILFTDHFSQPYIYALTARSTKPRMYWGGSLIKYQFVKFENTSALLRPNTLVVATPEDGFPIKEATKVIYGSDGEPRFLIYVNKP